MNLLRSAFSFSWATACSRVLGLIRDILFALFLGAGPITDAFIIAMKIPAMFRRLLTENAFSAAFLPLYVKLLQANKNAAASFAGNMIVIIALFLSVLVICLIFAMPVVLLTIVPGFAEHTNKIEIATTLTRISSPYLIAMGIVACLMGVLNAHGRFWLAGFSPAILNICLIIAFIAGQHLDKITHTYWLASAITFSGVLQICAFMFLIKKLRLKFSLDKNWKTPSFKKFLLMVGPAITSAGVLQINSLVGDIYASFLGNGAISWLYYADRLQQLPLALIGIALSTVLLPLFAKQFSANDTIAAKRSMGQAVFASLLMSIPSAIAFFIIGDLIIQVLFERGAFTVNDRMMAAGALKIYAIGLPAFILSKCLLPAYYATHNTKTPMKIAIICVFINAVAAYPLAQNYQHLGIAAALSFSAWFNFSALIFGLKLRNLLPIMNIQYQSVIVAFFIVAIMTSAIIVLEHVSHGLAPFLRLAFIIAIILPSYLLLMYKAGFLKEILDKNNAP